MTEKIPDAESLHHDLRIEALKPREDGPRFPELTRKELIELVNENWERWGIIVLLRKPGGEILVVVHCPGNPKVEEGTMGVPSETLQIDADGVEQPLPGISRLFNEELELTPEEIQSLNLQAVEHGAWQNVTFPLGGGRDALGLVIVLETDEESANTILLRGANLTPKSEIKFVNFINPDPLAHGAPVSDSFRPPTPRIFQAAMELLTTSRPKTRVELPPPKKMSENAIEDFRDLLKP